jgi:hypothetical protein
MTTSRSNSRNTGGLRILPDTFGAQRFGPTTATIVVAAEFTLHNSVKIISNRTESMVDLDLPHICEKLATVRACALVGLVP